MEFLKHILPNGLEIVAERNPKAYSTALGFFVRAGSRDETDEVAGVSHFLEHMMFKGTPTRTADDVNREFDEMGASYNAFTSEEHTVYYAAVLPEYQVQASELLADILRPSLRLEDFEMEKQVILEEIRMYEDQPPFGADEKCRALYFGEHPLARSVLGTVEEHQRPAGRRHARLLRSPIQSAESGAGGCRVRRLRPARGHGRIDVRALVAERSPQETRSRDPHQRISCGTEGLGHSAVRRRVRCRPGLP